MMAQSHHLDLPAYSRAIQVDEATHNVRPSQFDHFMREVNDFLSLLTPF